MDQSLTPSVKERMKSAEKRVCKERFLFTEDDEKILAADLQLSPNYQEFEEQWQSDSNMNMPLKKSRNLPAKEASLIARKAPLPQTHFPDTMSTNTSDLSVGAHSKNRCGDLGRILGKGSEKSHMIPGIPEASVSRTDYIKDEIPMTVDDTLDRCLAAGQPRNTDIHLEKSTTVGSHTDQFNSPVFIELTSDDSEESAETSLNLAKIAEYLGKNSDVSVTQMVQEAARKSKKKLFADTASSAGTVQTVMSIKIPKNEVPEVIITPPVANLIPEEEPKKATRSKSPSSRSPSNNYNSIKSTESPNCSFVGKSGVMMDGCLRISLLRSNMLQTNLDLVVPGSKIYINNDVATKIIVSNCGTVLSSWAIRCRHSSETKLPFKVSPTRFTLLPEETKTIKVLYTGSPDDGLVEIPIHFDELTTSESYDLILTGGTEKQKYFPIKSNAASLSWVRAGRKELSLKNSLDKRIHMRCEIVGDEFAIDLPDLGARGSYVLTFNANECRPLVILFNPNTCIPYSASLHITQDRSNNDSSRRIMLYGCDSGEPVRWFNHQEYSDTTALIHASGRANIEMRLWNKSDMPAFVAAKVHFNVQYMYAEGCGALHGAKAVIPSREVHRMLLEVNWERVRRRAGGASPAGRAFATVTVLTGAETTRRRILRILKQESKGNLDVSLLPEHVRVVAQEFENEDSEMDELFTEFSETKATLSELIQCGLQELTAHIDLQFSADDTIVMVDDTIVDHVTLCE